MEQRPMADDTCRFMARELHNTRLQLQVLESVYSKGKQQALEAYEVSHQIRILQAQIHDAKVKARLMENALLDEATRHYEETKEEQWLDGIGATRVYQKIEFDQAEMTAWAIDHDRPDLLRLDTVKFRHLAKTMDIDGVTITDDPMTSITSHLGRVLKAE